MIISKEKYKKTEKRRKVGRAGFEEGFDNNTIFCQFCKC